MTQVLTLSLVFALVTASSIVLLGSRQFVEGQMTLIRMIHILFDWKFILGAVLAFCARLLFIMTNNAIHKIPHLESSSTTITAIINTSAILVIILFNYLFLHEHLRFPQAIGTFLVILGIGILMFK